MNSKRSPGPPGAERIARATALIRALTGVVDAAIEADGTGIHSVAVVADASLSAWEVTRNVQSALLASLGLSIDTAIMEIRRPDADSANGGAAAGREGDGRASDNGGPSGSLNGKPILHGGHEARNGNGASNGKANGHPKTNGNGNGTGNGHADGLHAGRIVVPSALVVEMAAARPRAGGSVARVELESRLAGRVMCRVVVTTADRIAAGESEGVDTPAGRLEAAARAVIAASPIAGMDLDAVRLVELAGRKYVIAAVRQFGGRELVYRAEVAPVAASPEAAAAQAVLDAILQ